MCCFPEKGKEKHAKFSDDPINTQGCTVAVRYLLKLKECAGNICKGKENNNK